MLARQVDVCQALAWQQILGIIGCELCVGLHRLIQLACACIEVCQYDFGAHFLRVVVAQPDIDTLGVVEPLSLRVEKSKGVVGVA